MIADKCAVKTGLVHAPNPEIVAFLRIVNFYFFMDTSRFQRPIHAADVLGVLITSRGKIQGDNLPICARPIQELDDGIASAASVSNID